MQAPPDQPAAPAQTHGAAAPAIPADAAGQSGTAPAGSPLPRSKAALVSGYLGILPFIWAFAIFPYAYAGFPKWMKWKGPVITLVATLLLAIAPALITALIGHRTIRKNPGCQGKGHAVFSYVSCAMVFVVLAVAMVRFAIGR